MTLKQFIFSNRPSQRFFRHLTFWLLYFCYFYLQSLAPRTFEEFLSGDTYYFAFLNLLCFGPFIIFAAYFFIYYLSPKTIKKKKYIQFIIGFLLVYGMGTFLNFFTAGIFLNSVHYSTPIEPDFQHRLEFGNYNTRWGMIIATVALGIKLSKDWYLQQRENMEMLQKKNKAELQLQKALLHPNLLLRSLNTIYYYIQAGSEKALAMILNLSDLLSYSIYESSESLILLEKELSGLQNLAALERQNNKCSIDIYMPGEKDIQGKRIAPMSILKLFEKSIEELDNSGAAQPLLILRMMVANNQLRLDLSFNGLREAKPAMKFNLNLY